MLDKKTIDYAREFYKKHCKPRHKKICFAYKDTLFIDVYEDEMINIVVQYEYEFGRDNV